MGTNFVKNGMGDHSYIKKLRTENELLKKKLSEDFGMKHTEFNLDPILENQWLKHILEFETTYASARKLKVYEIIGKPDFKKAETLNRTEIKMELDRITYLLAQKNIHIENTTGQDPEKIYRFITEEIFEEVTQDMNIEGLNFCFVYEEPPAVN